MKFQQIIFPKSQNTETFWQLVIDNVDDLYKYLKLDSHLYAEALIGGSGSEYNEISLRADTLKRLNDFASLSTPVGELVYPTTVMDNHVNKKGQAMFKAIQEGNVVHVNKAGGWNYGFNDAIILQTIVKEDVQFPVDNQVRKASLLILENGSKGHEAELLETLNVILSNEVMKDMYTLYQLNLLDPKFVFESIVEAESIALETQALNLDQIERYMQLFSQLPTRKNVYIKTENINAFLGFWGLWEKNNEKHNIQFI